MSNKYEDTVSFALLTRVVTRSLWQASVQDRQVQRPQGHPLGSVEEGVRKGAVNLGLSVLLPQFPPGAWTTQSGMATHLGSFLHVQVRSLLNKCTGIPGFLVM